MDQTRLTLPVMKRAVSAELSVDDDTRMEFSFSSETAVERWFGNEVLSHDAGAADLSRLNDAAPLLWNHDPNQIIGVVENARIGGDKRGYATVRFGTSQKAQEILSDVRAGIIRNVSFGYRILDMVEEKRSGVPTYTATRWVPMEVSCVSIPADPTIGIGRDDSQDPREVVVRSLSPSISEEKTMSDAPVPAPAVDVSAVRAEAVAAERTRITSIRALGDKFQRDDLATSLIDGNRSLEEARAAFLEIAGAKQVPVSGGVQSGTVDMSDSEAQRYSIVRAINAACSGDWSKAGLEQEVSRSLAQKSGRDTNGFFMPLNLRMDTRASYAVGATGTGGATVATDLLAASFIEVLRNRAMIMQMGPTMLSGLVGNVAIPRQITATTTYWVTEATAITQAEATFDQVTLSPKQLGARSQYSRLMLQQATPDIETIVRNDLARVMALGIDSAAISGSGASGQPRGILNTSGIGSVAMGANGAALVNAATSGTTGLDQIFLLERAVDVANALSGNMYYLTNAKVIAALKQLKSAQADYIWTTDRFNDTLGTAGNLNGFPCARSNQVPSNLVKGCSGAVCSALLYGDFSQLVIGMWGGLEILPNPYGSGYTAGSVDIRAMQTCDIAVRHPESFAAITDILAT